MIRVLRAIALVFPLVALAACAVNPATGERSFTAFMSREKEVQVGNEEHPKILQKFGGRYGDQRLATYVQEIGNSLARVTESPEIPFSFTILNDDKVNAFALPGGFVYITRGLLALADDEAQVASVLAHEIGHITARHTAQQYSQATAANIGLTVLGVLGSIAGAPVGVGDLASLGVSAILQGYSRGQENEADMLAVRYMARVGYDPHAIGSFFRKLEGDEKLTAALQGKKPGAKGPRLMASHPLTRERITLVTKLAEETPVKNPRLGRETYLARIDGLVFGDDLREGVRSGRQFSHPGLQVRFTVPPGFSMQNAPGQVVASGPGGGALAFSLVGGKKARQAGSPLTYLTRDWGSKIRLKGVERLNINGMEAATGQATLSAGNGNKDLRLVAVRERPDRIFRFLFLSPPALTNKIDGEFRRTAYSFQRLSPAEAAAIQPLRVRVVNVTANDSPEKLASLFPYAKFRLQRFNLLNGLSAGQPLQPGSKVKIIVN